MRGYLQATIEEFRKALASHNTGLHARARIDEARRFMGENSCIHENFYPAATLALYARKSRGGAGAEARGPSTQAWRAAMQVLGTGKKRPRPQAQDQCR